MPVSRRGTAAGTKTQDDSCCAMVPLLRRNALKSDTKIQRIKHTLTRTRRGTVVLFPIFYHHLASLRLWAMPLGRRWRCSYVRLPRQKFKPIRSGVVSYTQTHVLTAVRTTTRAGGGNWDGFGFALRWRRECCEMRVVQWDPYTMKQAVTYVSLRDTRLSCYRFRQRPCPY